MTAPVLALDIATDCGWAVLRGNGRVESGTERFAPKAHEAPGGRFNRFRRWLVDVKQANPDLARVAYEDVVFVGNPGAAYAVQLYGGFLAVVLMFCDHHQLEAKGYGVATVKKRFTGSGKASKDDVMKQCRALNFNPGDHNEADAIAVLHVATDRCPVLTMTGATPRKRAPKPTPAMQPGVDPF